MTYDESLENDRELLEAIKPEPYKEVFCVIHSYGNKHLSDLVLSFCSEIMQESEEALENDTLTAALCENKEVKNIHLCRINEQYLDKRRINSCSNHLEILITNKIN